MTKAKMYFYGDDAEGNYEMLLAQITESTEVVNKLIETSNAYGFAALSLMVFFLTVCLGAAIHFIKIVIPERDARVKAHEKLADCMTVMTEQDIRQTTLLEQQSISNGEIKSKLSDIKDIASKSHCEARVFMRGANAPMQPSHGGTP